MSEKALREALQLLETAATALDAATPDDCCGMTYRPSGHAVPVKDQIVREIRAFLALPESQGDSITQKQPASRYRILAEQLTHATERVRLASAKTQHEDSPLHLALGDLYGCIGHVARVLWSEQPRIPTPPAVPSERGECSHCGVSYPLPVSYHHTEDECASNKKEPPAEQGEPVAWMLIGEPAGVWGQTKNVYIKRPSAEEVVECGPGSRVVPLYAHPSPVPAGMKLVPVEPTEEMQEAARKISDEYPYKPSPNGQKLGYLQTALIYRAMLAAAPEGGK